MPLLGASVPGSEPKSCETFTAFIQSGEISTLNRHVIELLVILRCCINIFSSKLSLTNKATMFVNRQTQATYIHVVQVKFLGVNNKLRPNRVTISDPQFDDFWLSQRP